MQSEFLKHFIYFSISCLIITLKLSCMKLSEFIEKLKEVLEIEDHEIYSTDIFREYDEWDSIAYLSVIAFLDEEFEIQFEESDFKKLITIEDLYNITVK